MTLFRWFQQFTPLLVEAARPCRHSVGGHWFVDETYVKVSGSWRYIYRAVDQYGQVIDVFLSRRRDLNAARAFFATAIRSHGDPVEVTTNQAHALVRVIAELLPAARHDTTQYANNRVEADHGHLKARLRPVRGLKRDRTASVVFRGHALIQKLRRGHYELGLPAHEALAIAGRRRLSGTAAQSILVALLLMAANVRKIQAFITSRSSANPDTPARRARRRRTRSVKIWRPEAPANSTTGPDPPVVS